MQRREFITLLGGAAVMWPRSVIAETPAKVYRIGLLSAGAPVADASPNGVGMRQAGVILIRQKINLIAGLPQLGSSEIGIKVRVPLYVVRKIGITQSAAEGDARHQLRCHPRQP